MIDDTTLQGDADIALIHLRVTQMSMSGSTRAR